MASRSLQCSCKSKVCGRGKEKDSRYSASIFWLEGKVVIVTGGASGIGASTVALFHEHDAKVVIADIQDNIGQSLADNISGGDIAYIHCDVTNSAP